MLRDLLCFFLDILAFVASTKLTWGLGIIAVVVPVGLVWNKFWPVTAAEGKKVGKAESK